MSMKCFICYICVTFRSVLPRIENPSSMKQKCNSFNGPYKTKFINIKLLKEVEVVEVLFPAFSLVHENIRIAFYLRNLQFK